MFKKQILKVPIFLLASLFVFLGATVDTSADICPEQRKKQEANELQRKVDGAYGNDLQFNTISNLEFCVTNTGKSFFNEKFRRGTGIWPRGSINYYIFGGGIWVGSKKRNYLLDSAGNFLYNDSLTTIVEQVKWDRDKPVLNDKGDTLEFEQKTVVDTIKVRLTDPKPNSIMAFSYNPNSAESSMAQGRIEDGDDADPSETRKYRVFLSQDYSPGDGSPLMEESGPAWPIWDVSDDPDDVLKYDRYFGRYVRDEADRNLTTYPRGPAFISGEDIFCTYKDTDLSRYGDFGGKGSLILKGYPQRVQYEQMIYSWGFGDYRDFVFIKYDQINKNKDTLWDVWLAPVYDVDITLAINYQQGASNDITCFYGMEGKVRPEEPDPAKAAKNMAYQYSLGTMGEAGRGFGYCGFVFLESPAVITQCYDIVEYGGKKDTLKIVGDSLNFIRKDKRVIYDSISQREKTVSWYPVPEQLGLVTFRNWPISEDKKKDEEMYQFISTKEKDGPGAPGDMRYMMATGPFHMRPMDTARTVVGLVIAATGKGGDADGTDEDLAELVRKVDFMQKVYDENFRAPQPPARAGIIEWTPLNNGMMIQWDSTAEMSIDNYERGLAFMGYRIYRARRLNLDTFHNSNISGNSMYPSGQGPFGWKELKTYTLPTPYLKSQQFDKGYGPYIKDQNLGPRAQIFAGIDSMMAVGPVWEGDTMSLNKILVMKIPSGVNMYPPFVLHRLLYDSSNSPLPGIPANMFSSKLTEAGYYGDNVFGKRVNAVINSVDSFSYPWGSFYAKQATKDGFDFDKSAKYYNPTHKKSFLVDSVMLCTLELNPALAIINPLFYHQRRVNIQPNVLERLLLPATDTNHKRPDVWITRGDSVLNPVTGKMEWVITRIKIDTLYILGTEEVNPAGNQWTISVVLRRDSTQWLNTLEHYNYVMDSIYSYISKGYIRNYVTANFTPGGMFKTDFSSSEIAKKEVIAPYMREITNNRTFIDVGDDPEPGMTRGDGVINESNDITKTERLFNNVEYHYKVISFDEGDFGQPTPIKNNEGLVGLPNLVTTYPSAERAGRKVNFEVIHKDSEKLGGLFNFNLFAIDEQRVSQLFTGDTIEVEFTPVTWSSTLPIISKTLKDSIISVETPIGFYATGIKMTNLTKGQVIYQGTTQLETTPCQTPLVTTFVDHSVARAGSDTMVVELKPTGVDSVGNPVYELSVGYDTSSYEYPVVNNHFTTGNFKTRNFCYTVGGGQDQTMYGTLGLSFDAALKQYGGMYRGHKADRLNTNVSTDVRALPIADGWRNPERNHNLMPQNARYVGNEVRGLYLRDTYTTGALINEGIGWNALHARFDNGPGEYEVEFQPGGEEDLLIYFDNGQPKTYKAKYLIPVVKDKHSYKRLAIERNDVDSVEVRYPSDIAHMVLPVQPRTEIQVRNGFRYRKMATPSPLLLPYIGRDATDFYRKFNLYAQGYVNARRVSTLNGPSRLAIDYNLQQAYGDHPAHYVGTQGRYYLTAFSPDGDTLDFVHTINIAGAQFVMSYLQRGVRTDGVDERWDRYDVYPPYVPTSTANHIYAADFAVGDKIILKSFGGASGFPEKGAKVRFAVKDVSEMNDDILDQIRVVPNPYVISHQGQKSAYDAKLYFTKLPRKCTIDIYTASGDLVTTIEHDEDTGGRMNAAPGEAVLAGDGVALFDLLTKNGQRVQSQTLIAFIKTPCGAMTTKQFSVIVGGFRIID